MSRVILDRLIVLSISRKIENEFSGKMKVQLPGINRVAGINDFEWISVYLLNLKPVPSRKGTVRDGLIQISCFCRYFEAEFDRPYLNADKINKLLSHKSLEIIDFNFPGGERNLGCINFGDSESNYFPVEKEKNTHAVILTFKIRASTN